MFSLGHFVSPLLPDRSGNSIRPSTIRQPNVVGTFWPARKDPGRGCADLVAMHVERPQITFFVFGYIRLQSPQHIGVNEERAFHCAIIAPETDCTPGGVVAAAVVRKADRHVFQFGSGSSLLRACRTGMRKPRDGQRCWSGVMGDIVMVALICPDHSARNCAQKRAASRLASA